MNEPQQAPRAGEFQQYLPETLIVDGTPLSYIDVGEGPAVLLLHSGGGNNLQWRPLIDRLAGAYRVLAPDMPGHGLTPPRSHADLHRLPGIVALYSALLARVEGPLHIVGHSMGATYALELALAQHERVRSLTLAEPSAFALLPAAGEAAAWDEIVAVATRHRELVAAGDLDRCAEVFMGYWIGLDAWRSMPPGRQEAVKRTLSVIADGWQDAFEPIYTPERYRPLAVPTLLLRGTHTTLAARTVIQVLHETLPQRHLLEVSGAGHMAPVSHPEAVNAAIVAHVLRHTAPHWSSERDVA